MKEIVVILMVVVTLAMDLDLYLEIKKAKQNLKNLLDQEGYQLDDFIKRGR